MNAQFIDIQGIKAFDLPDLMTSNKMQYHAIACNNWPEAFPYSPKSKFAIAYTDYAILLHFISAEQCLRAFVRDDNGDVWTDACVEMFFAPDGDDRYYNLECNCIGKLLLGFGTERHDRQRAPLELLQQIDRWTSLDPAFTSSMQETGKSLQLTTWQLALVVPFSVFYAHSIQSLRNVNAKANFYKCGGSMQYEHYLTYEPIKTKTPDFHRPEFFKGLCFK